MSVDFDDFLKRTCDLTLADAVGLPENKLLITAWFLADDIAMRLEALEKVVATFGCPEPQVCGNKVQFHLSFIS